MHLETRELENNCRKLLHNTRKPIRITAKNRAYNAQSHSSLGKRNPLSQLILGASNYRPAAVHLSSVCLYENAMTPSNHDTRGCFVNDRLSHFISAVIGRTDTSLVDHGVIIQNVETDSVHTVHAASFVLHGVCEQSYGGLRAEARGEFLCRIKTIFNASMF